MELINVIAVAKRTDEPVFIVIIEADIGDGPELMEYALLPGDQEGLAPVIQAWLDERPEFPVYDAGTTSVEWDFDNSQWVVPPEPFKTLSRPAFFFMAKKLGVTEADMLALVAAMPDTTQEEQDAKDLAESVVKYQQDFRRENELLNSLVIAQGLTETQVNNAWRTAEGVTW